MPTSTLTERLGKVGLWVSGAAPSAAGGPAAFARRVEAVGVDAVPATRPVGRTNRAVGTDLTGRELEILELLADGMSGRSIAARLYLSNNTIRNHVQNILDTLGALCRLQAVAIAVKEGIIDRR